MRRENTDAESSPKPAESPDMVWVNRAEYNSLRECMIEAADEIKRLRAPSPEPPQEIFSRPECPFNYCDTKAPHTECLKGCRYVEPDRGMDRPVDDNRAPEQADNAAAPQENGRTCPKCGTSWNANVENCPECSKISGASGLIDTQG